MGICCCCSKNYLEGGSILAEFLISNKDVEEEQTIFNPGKCGFIEGMKINLLNYQIRINGEEITTTEKYKFPKEGKYSIKYTLLKPYTQAEMLFSNCQCLSTVNLSQFYAGRIQSVKNMFSNCGSLEHVDFSGLDLKYVTNMSSLFAHCKLLKSVNFADLDLRNVVDMAEMFLNCLSLKNVIFSGVKTQILKSMKNMFKGCASLEEVDLSDFKAYYVEDMTRMFEDCVELKKVKFPKFNSQIINSKNMFQNCSKLNRKELSQKIKKLLKIM